MPTLSASDYTSYLKLKAAATSYQNGNIPKKVQNVDQASPLVSILNANIFTSQASLVSNPTITKLVRNARVQGIQAEKSNNPNALSTLSFSGTSGAMSSSAYQRPGGLPANGQVGNNYTRLPQHAGWIQGNMVSSGAKRF